MCVFAFACRAVFRRTTNRPRSGRHPHVEKNDVGAGRAGSHGAGAVADSILHCDDLVKQVQVTLSKPAAPIPDFGGKITIELIRSK